MMLLDGLSELDLSAPADVLELCCGTGIVAIAAAQRGHHVDAVDSSRLAVICARRNATLNGVNVAVFQGDLFEPIRGRQYDAIVVNPPYVPTPPGATVPLDWCDGGEDGRAIIDRICSSAVRHLVPGGYLLLVQSSLADTSRTLLDLDTRGLRPEVLSVRDEPLGPISRERRDFLIDLGAIRSGDTHERLALVRAQRPR